MQHSCQDTHELTVTPKTKTNSPNVDE